MLYLYSVKMLYNALYIAIMIYRKVTKNLPPSPIL